MDTVYIRKTNSLIISSALSIVLLTITLSIMLSSNHHFLPNSSAQAQTFANNTDSVIIPNNIRLNFSELFTRVESSVLQVTDPSAPGLLGPRLGSGFVYDKEGHIITNNHVVAGGSGDLDITFIDGTVYDARLVGSDPYADLAVLKVAAVGSPFGLSGSITEGIISGLGRSLPSSVPQDPTIPQLDVPSLPPPPAFSIPDIIQTDAAINPGNSGGPLLNMGGEVVGINTAIFSNTGSYSGVGFAIPSNMIKKVVTSLIATGSYTHPYIGITGLDITPEVAEAIGLQEARGFLVTDVTAEGPAAKAGVQGGDLLADINGREIELGGDVILEIDNKTVRKIDDILTYLEREKQIGDIVQLTVLRDGQLQEIPVTLAARPTPSQEQQPQQLSQSPDQPSLGILGIDITPEIAEAMGLQEAIGFLVTDVIKGGPSDKAGIRGGYIVANINGTEIELGGDVILEIDNETVRTINDILTYLNTQRKVGDIVQLTVLRDGQLQEIPVPLAASSTLPEFANPEAPLQPDESLPAPPSPPPSQPPDRDGLFGNLYDECIKMASKEVCDL